MEKTFVNREKLKEKMAEKGLNFSDIARILGINRSSVRRKFSTERRFAEDEILKLVKVFGRSILNL